MLILASPLSENTVASHNVPFEKDGPWYDVVIKAEVVRIIRAKRPNRKDSVRNLAEGSFARRNCKRRIADGW